MVSFQQTFRNYRRKLDTGCTLDELGLGKYLSRRVSDLKDNRKSINILHACNGSNIEHYITDDTAVQPATPASTCVNGDLTNDIR